MQLQAIGAKEEAGCAMCC